MYYLHRDTPLDDWTVYVQPPADGETIYLGDCTWYSEAQAEADRLNGKQGWGTGEPPDMSIYEQIGQEIGSLVDAKQAQYGNSFDVAPAILSYLYPDGVPVERYADLLAMVRILDKLKRIATARADDPEDAWSDIAGYSLLMLERGRRGKDGAE